MASPSSVAFYDPTGERYGIPTYPWKQAPPHLATRRQLAAARLRPGGQEVQAQVLWRSRRSVRAAYLYDTGRALPKRAPTDAQLAALAKALRVRRTCPRCGHERTYVIPTRIGACLDCATEWEMSAA